MILPGRMAYGLLTYKGSQGYQTKPIPVCTARGGMPHKPNKTTLNTTSSSNPSLGGWERRRTIGRIIGPRLFPWLGFNAPSCGLGWGRAPGVQPPNNAILRALLGGARQGIRPIWLRMPPLMKPSARAKPWPGPGPRLRPAYPTLFKREVHWRSRATSCQVGEPGTASREAYEQSDPNMKKTGKRKLKG